MNRVLSGALAALLGILLVACDQTPEREPLPINTRLGGAVTLTNQDGEAFNTTSLEGKVVFLFFGYTSCPDICPATLARVIRSRRSMKSRRAVQQHPAWIRCATKPKVPLAHRRKIKSSRS